MSATKSAVIFIGSALFVLFVIFVGVMVVKVEKQAPRLDSDYLTEVKSKSPSLVNLSDGQLISMGKSVCQGFEGGDEKYQIAEVISMANGISTSQAGVVIEAAVPNYCPQFKGRL